MMEDSVSEANTVSESPSQEPAGTVGEALKGMFSFFTMLPINIEMKEMNAMNRRFWLVPVIGLFYGLLALLVFGCVSYYLSTFVAAVCSLFTIHIFNRFLHLDGMIDIGDGLTVAGKREDHLRALKDTRIGAGGMATGLFVTLLTVSCISQIWDWKSFLFIGAACEVIARNAQVSAAAFGTPGNGMAGDSVRFTDARGLVCSSILTATIIVALFLIGGAIVGFDWYCFEACCCAVAVAFIASIAWGYLMSRIAERNFGMVNGDVLGATNESSRAILLLMALIVISVVL